MTFSGKLRKGALARVGSVLYFNGGGSLQGNVKLSKLIKFYTEDVCISQYVNVSSIYKEKEKNASGE